MGGWYWVSRKKIDAGVFLIASFKIYLTIFLAFIQIPYTYLMVTAIGVSIAMFAAMSNWKILNASTEAAPEAVREGMLPV